MLLVSVQNQKTKETNVCVVADGKINEFLTLCVPAGCIAFVQDVPLYDGLKPEFKKRWFNSEND